MFSCYLAAILIGSISDSLTHLLESKGVLTKKEAICTFFVLFLPRLTSVGQAASHLAFGVTILISQEVIKRQRATKEEQREEERDLKIDNHLKCKWLLHEYPLNPAYLEYEGMEFQLDPDSLFNQKVRKIKNYEN